MINMTRNVHVFTRENGQLVKTIPSSKECLYGRKMASTLHNIIRDMHKAHSHSWSYESTIGHMEVVIASRGKRQTLTLRMRDFELKDYDIRNFLVLAVQYMTGEYPYLIVNMTGDIAEISLPSGNNWYQVVGCEQ